MKKIPALLKSIFGPRELQNLDSVEILAALNDPTVRRLWLHGVYDELKRLNLDVDKRVFSGNSFRLSDLCARRKAFQDVLEWILQASRNERSTQKSGHNPVLPSDVNLDSVTV